MGRREYVPYDKDPYYATTREARRRDDEWRAANRTTLTREQPNTRLEALLALPFAEVGAVAAGANRGFLAGETVKLLSGRVQPKYRDRFGEFRTSYGGTEWLFPGLLAWELAVAMLPGDSEAARGGTNSKDTLAALGITLWVCDQRGRDTIVALCSFVQLHDLRAPDLWKRAFDFIVELAP